MCKTVLRGDGKAAITQILQYVSSYISTSIKLSLQLASGLKGRATERGQVAPGAPRLKGPHKTQCFKVLGPHNVKERKTRGNFPKLIS